MAQRRIVELIDDLDDTTIEDGGTQTFSLNGTAYEIDLSAANLEKMR
ncbi:histone-like nucleoid-structuring protein Lsr2 [Microbacterium sp.]|nr:histone-like nucleoid-structuring protein Lsr2 [Microbacterium sp.]